MDEAISQESQEIIEDIIEKVFANLIEKKKELAEFTEQDRNRYTYIRQQMNYLMDVTKNVIEDYKGKYEPEKTSNLSNLPNPPNLSNLPNLPNLPDEPNVSKGGQREEEK